ncbi:glucosamine-6-phosphate deaminase [Terriglobus roseus]|uniref:Glucosamine-6-phosphate deaminase n=1 Tax=Terriglobus roseus TaxID=392734 RepID=A0A1H4JU24_9BACT|nr:glucosamine-6-phosphate deaminase [Terriglobus roseus]SEB49824.1 glucosamine-6-phosphate deaminase [Terriglobus roseus]
MDVRVFPTKEQMGRAAAQDIGKALRLRLSSQSHVRVVFAAAPSQSTMLSALRQEPGIDWSRVTAFHMDEYLGLSQDAPQRFGNWLMHEFFHHVPLGQVHLMNPGVRPEDACAEYERLLAPEPIDIVLLGIGTNGHLAFNDPPADLKDTRLVKRVTLDAACREQQVFDECFPSLEAVPQEAMTMTTPALLRAKEIFGCVPGEHKSAAVQAMLEEPVSGACPATALRTHPHCTVYLDFASASRSRLSERF